MLYQDPFEESVSGLASKRRYFLTSADLRDVVEVTPCGSWRRRVPEESRVMGLILTYENGTRRSMGQVRHDKLGPTIDVRSTECMWLEGLDFRERATAGNLPDHLPYGLIGLFGVTGIHLSHPDTTQHGRYLRIPWCGRLDWRFGLGSLCRHCHISHVEKGRVVDGNRADPGRAVQASSLKVLRVGNWPKYT
jgi:hypothetical protein